MPACQVVGVVTARRVFPISYRPEGVTNVLHADVERFAASEGLPCQVLDRSMSDTGLLEAVAAWGGEAFLVAGWYHMVPKTWRDLAPAYGLHASLLPDYSGGAPLVWAMINGEAKTGITLFQMDGGVDTGPIVNQATELIRADDTIATLYARIEERGLELLAETIPQLADGSVILRPQPTEGRRVMPQRSPEDGRIDWAADAKSLERFVRAQTRPYPGAFSKLNGNVLTIWAAHSATHEGPDLPSGSIVERSGALAVICGEGVLLLDEIDIGGRVFEGDRVASVLHQGDRLEPRD